MDQNHDNYVKQAKKVKYDGNLEIVKQIPSNYSKYSDFKFQNIKKDTFFIKMILNNEKCVINKNKFS